MGDIADYMTLADAASELGVSKSRIRQYLGDGRLPFEEHLGLILVRRADVVLLKSAPKKPRGRPAKPSTEKAD